MKARFWLFRRTNGVFYYEDTQTGKQESLGTRDRKEAKRLIHAKAEAQQQPRLNLQIARAYLMASDPDISGRTWQHVMNEIVKTKTGSTQLRWSRAIKDKAFNLIRDLPILETQSQHFLRVLETGTVATNVYLRRLHNFALDMNWLPWPLVVKRQWPRPQFKEKRAITWEEHRHIVEREKNPERKAFYELAWHLGASQSDLANLHAEDVDWENRVISFERMKTRWRGQQPPQVCFGSDVERILESLPRSGPLFPYLRTVRSGDRATEFKQRCVGLGIRGVSLHSYRYAWAERAKTCGYPERFAQQALGHNSKAIHRAYAKKAKVRVPALEDYEKAYTERKIVPMRLQNAEPVDMRRPETPAAIR
jgi:integrase